MNHRILVIDDNPAIHADIRKILSKSAVADDSIDEAEALLFASGPAPTVSLDFEIDSAYQGQEGLEKVKQALAQNKPYSLAFVDVRMPPGWDGIETISRIWEVCDDLQVVICTAYSDYSWTEMTRRIRKPDSVLILKKPFDNIEVLQMAHALTKKWSLAQEAKSQLSNLDNMVTARTEELQRANHRLTLSEERFAKAFNSSPIPMSIQSLRDYRYLDVNESYLAMTGYTRGELLGKSAHELQIWPEAAARVEVFDQLRAGRGVQNLEGSIGSKGGKERPTLLSAESITLGTEQYALISEVDLSHRLQLESQLRQAQKMEAIGKLAAGVAHDFRNMLTVILGHANLRLLDKTLAPDVANSFKQIAEAGERASSLTRQLLAFSRKQIIQLQAVNLNEIIAQISTMLGRLIGENIRLECNYCQDLPLIEADTCSIEQVLMNLVVNARDAMREGGRLTLSTQVVQIDESTAHSNIEVAPGVFACITVTDTGCGMDAATVACLFEPFFTTKEVGKGTGMGLATVYGIVKQHNGWVEVKSAPGEGTTFRVYFPVTAKGKVLVESKPAATGAFQGNETILVVEDEEPVRRFVSDVLQQCGYEVHQASNGVEALRAWEESEQRIDLLFTDIVMPESISGLQLADKLLAEKQDLKVIYTTGYSIELLERHFQSQAKVNFLPKPFHPTKLAEAVRESLDGVCSQPAASCPG